MALTNPVNDIDRGRAALKYFHNRSCAYSPYKETLDSLISKVGGKRPEFFLEGLGMAINTIGMSDSQVRDAMTNLAEVSHGQVPQNSVFYKALSNRVSSLTTGDWIKGLPEIAGNTALDAAKGFEAVGNAVLDVGKSLLTVGPLLVVVAIIFIGYQRTRKFAG